MKFTFAVLLLLFASCAASLAQSGPQCPGGSVAYPNDTGTGTTLYTLTKLNASGNAVIMANTDTQGYLGVAVYNAGKAGTVCLATNGIWPLIVDATTTLRHYIQISPTTGGYGHDTGATTLPIANGDIIGQVQAASTGGGGISMLSLNVEFPGVNPSGAGITGPGTTVVADIITWGNTLGTTALDPGTAQVVNGALHAANTYYSTAFTTAAVTPTTVSGLTSPSIAAGSFVSGHCTGYWSTSATNGHNEMQINASQTPQLIWYNFINWTSSTTQQAKVSQTNATLQDGGANATSANLEPWSLDFTIQWHASNAGTFTLQAATNTVSATLTIGTGAVCAINP